MTTPAPVPVCPYLGLADDPATHLVFPSHSQRCHATTRPSIIETAKQAKDCLTEAHTGCSRYRPYVGPVPHGDAFRAAIAAVTPEPGHSASPRSGVRATARVVPVAILLLALALAGIVLGAWLASAMSDTPAGSGAPGPGASGTAGSLLASPTPLATPTAPPTATPTAPPTATPTAKPTPTPTATPTPAPTPLVHRVRRGDTLSAIAIRYGVTIEAIIKANKLADPNLIVVGQSLVIPVR